VNTGAAPASAPTLAGLPTFLHYLATFPEPADVVGALHRGPMAHLSAPSVFLWRLADGRELVRLGSSGHTREEAERYAVIPLDVDTAAVRAVRTRTIQVDDVAAFPRDNYAALDEQLLSAMIQRLAAAAIVSAPIVHGGRAIGVLGFAVTRPWADIDIAPAVTAALTGALAVWLTHPQAGLADTVSPSAREWSMAFTPRQRNILALVEEGRANTSIAMRLYVSESSVKQDLMQAMRVLRTSDRHVAAKRARMLGLL
jgi:DNA-binding NarL/FixJ family response regulator